MPGIADLAPTSFKDGLNLAAAILGIVGTPLGVLFYYWSIRKPSPCYAIRSSQVISPENIHHELVVTLKGRAVEKLVVSRLAFWNAGNVTIRRQNIALRDGNASPHDDRLQDHCIELVSNEQCEILDFDILHSTSGSIAKTFDEIDIGGRQYTRIGLDFSYMKPGEGFVLTLAHEGAISDQPGFAFNVIDGGKLKRMTPGNAMASAVIQGRHKSLRKWLPKALAAMGFAMIALALCLYLRSSPAPLQFLAGEFLLFGMGISYVVFAYALRGRMPIDLLVFFSE